MRGGEVIGRADALDGDRWRQQSPLLLPLDLGSKTADWGLPRLSVIQSAIHGWPIGLPCPGLLLWVKWSAGTLLILISLSIRPYSSVNESVCQSHRFWCCRFPEQPGLGAGAGNRRLDERLGCWIPQFIRHFVIADWKETAWTPAIAVWSWRNDRCWWLFYSLLRPVYKFLLLTAVSQDSAGECLHHCLIDWMEPKSFHRWLEFLTSQSKELLIKKKRRCIQRPFITPVHLCDR